MGVIETDGKCYVTYMTKGTEFSPTMIKTNLSSSYLCKPEDAWWGSPEDADYGWKEWCKSESFGNYDFGKPIRWHLEKGSKIFQIDDESVFNLDLDNEFLKYVYFEDIDFNTIRMPFEEMVRYLKFERSQDCYCDPEYKNLKINFYKLLDDGFVAVELMNSCIGHCFINKVEIMFNGWDCESIVVLDPDKIVFE